ncbi:MAG TPA: hypothetical protein VIH21_04380 [Dehalococcoidia bacterium]|jgi:hypothetical protein
MEPEPVFEKSVDLPFGFVFTARARPSTVRRTALRLVPWALVLAVPSGRMTKFALIAAKRLSPMMKQKVR